PNLLYRVVGRRDRVRGTDALAIPNLNPAFGALRIGDTNAAFGAFVIADAERNPERTDADPLGHRNPGRPRRSKPSWRLWRDYALGRPHRFLHREEHLCANQYARHCRSGDWLRRRSA